MSSTKRFCCIQCKFFTDTNGHLKQHLLTKKHLSMKNENASEMESKSTFDCEKCERKYQTKSGLKKHCQKCKVIKTIVPQTIVPVIVSIDLQNKIDSLEKVIDNLAVLVKNQQSSTTINNNISNYINIFLNDKCRNACDIKKFIAGIDFSKENYHNLLMDYVGGNAEIITKNYNNLPEFERPVYCFSGEDKHQQIAHIQHENSWVVEPELSWERQVQREQDEIEDDPEPNSMYSLVRLFDKKKMEYFDENYKQSHLYLSQRKFNKDCLDGNNQVKLINKIIEMATVEA
jgi:hypothetical protein